MKDLLKAIVLDAAPEDLKVHLQLLGAERSYDVMRSTIEVYLRNRGLWNAGGGDKDGMGGDPMEIGGALALRMVAKAPVGAAVEITTLQIALTSRRYAGHVARQVIWQRCAGPVERTEAKMEANKVGASRAPRLVGNRPVARMVARTVASTTKTMTARSTKTCSAMCVVKKVIRLGSVLNASSQWRWMLLARWLHNTRLPQRRQCQ